MGLTPEEWDQLSHQEKLEHIRQGRFSTNLIQKIREDADPELVEALDKYLEEHKPEPLRSVFQKLQSRPASALLTDLFSNRHVELPNVRMPPIMPTSLTPEQTHGYESAARFIDRLQTRYELWVNGLPENVQPAIYAVLGNGVVVRAERFEPDGHNGVAITGFIEGVPTHCLVIMHQAGVQLLCVAESVEPKSERRVIGFYTGREAESPTDRNL